MGTECQHVVRFMTRRTPKTGRLDLRPETCPPQINLRFQDPGSAGIPGLFLGLFDVSRCWRVAGEVGVPGVWVKTGPKLSKTGPKTSQIALKLSKTGPKTMKFSKTGTKFSEMRVIVPWAHIRQCTRMCLVS